MLIGIIGGVGSGKSTVSDILRENYGFTLITLDDTAKELEKPGRPVYGELVEAFGPHILKGGKPGNPIDNEKFAAIIYSDQISLLKANAIIHPRVWQAARKEAAFLEKCCIETALPDENFKGWCDMVWYVWADRETRIKRLMETRGYTREKCVEIMKNQKHDDEFNRIADAAIDNSSGIRELKLRIAELME